MSAHPDTLVSRPGAGERTSPALPGAGPALPYDRDASIPDVFEGVVERCPGAMAVEQGPRSLTYSELDAAADRLAWRLAERGFGPGGLVGVAIERSPEAIVAFLGVLKAGAAYLPLDLEHPPKRLALMLEEAHAVAVLAVGEGLERLDGLSLPAPPLDLYGAERVPDGRPERRSGGEDVAYVIYTSGSTGSPKGVEALHRGVVREVRGSGHSAIAPGDVVLGANPFIFDGSIHEIYGPLLNGARLVLAPAGIPSPEIMRRLVREHEVSVVMPPAAVFCELVDAGLSGFEGVREFFVGGDVLSPDHVRRALRALPECSVVNCYGPAEATCDACAHRMADPAAVGDRVPIGRPLGNTRAYVLDARMQPVEPGAPGELYLGGDGLARGYRESPELTAERFVADPFDPEGRERLYRTGDRIRLLDDGTLDFLGRLDDQVKIRGFRVEPAEVEAALASHPAVSRCAVAARDDGPGHLRLVAYAVPRESEVSADRLREDLAAELPAHMVPSEVVMTAALPQTASGKVDRRALRPPSRSSAGRGPAPRSEVETRLAAIWADLLDLDGIGMDDDFLALGGDSLLVMRLVARIAGREGVELPPEAVFESPTLGALAARIAERATGADGAGWAPIRRSDDHAFAPLTFAQERTWFLQRLEPSSLAYQFQDLLWLEGDLDVAALRRALRALVRRHESLRTTFPWGDGGPIQVIHAPWRVRLRPIDLTHLPESEREPALREQVAERVRRPFDITRLPLARWALFRFDERRHALLHLEHHLIHDGWSWALFRRELAELYAAFAHGLPSPLPDAEIQLADFARWQRSAMSDEPAASQLERWRRRLSPPPPALALPSDRPRPPRQTFRGGRLQADLPAETVERLRALGASEGATPFMIMLTAFYALLHGLTAEEDLCVGTGVANRRRPESERVLGMVLNTLALRLDAGGDPTGRELLRRARATVIEALANQDVPFDRVVDAVRPRRDPGRMPLFDVLFSFDDSPRPPTSAGGLEIVADEGVTNSSAKADLNVIVVSRGEGRCGVGLRTLWEYNADLFDAETAARMLAAYRGALDALLDAPERRLSDLLAATGLSPTGPGAEEVAAGDAERAPYERDATIAQLFEARASERPDAPALELGRRALSYRELDEAANRLARRLRALGAGPESLVGVFMERSLELVVGLLGILKAGAAYLPLEPEYPPARLAFMLSDADAPLVLTQTALAERLPGNVARVLALDPALEALAGEPADPVESDIGPESLAYVMYTSGSTGRPKGVEALHRGVVRLVRGTDYADFGPDQTNLLLAPIAFDASTFEIWGALLNGGRLAIAPPGLPSLAELGEIVRRHRVTTLWLSAGMFREVVDGNRAGLGGLRQLLAGGDVLSPSHVRRALEAHPGLRLINGYGPTETTTFACCHTINDPTEVDGPIPIGRPIANTTIRILDRDGHPAPDGTEGELYIGGDGLARGYRGRPRLTADRFVADRLSPGERLYRTGDLVRRRPDGALDFLGRLDDQVKIRGFRVEPGEVEAALTEHPDVAAGAVVVQADGSGEKRLLAFVVPRAGSAGLDPLPWLAERLPAHMMPSSCMAVDTLPLSPNGKVDRARLAAGAPAGAGDRDGAPAAAAAGLGRNGGAPRTGTERRLATIWGRLLDARAVRRNDDFFSLGGHSLMTLRLFADIELEFGRRLPVASIFESPTLAQLARRIDTDGAEAAWKSLVPIAPAGWKRPFFCVHGAGGNVALFAKLGRSLDPERPLYGLQAQGLDGTTRPHRQIETMAAHYLAEIRGVQPRGPYILGGICKGAQVALEMSQQLQAAGEEVSLLVVLDSKEPNLYGAARRDARRRRQRRRQRSKAETPRDRRVRHLRKRWRRARMLLRRARRRSWPERIGAARATFRPPPDREHLRRVRRANSRAIRTYVARPFAGRIALIESEQTARRPERGARLGWTRVASGGLDYVVAPGDHRSMLREPQVRVVAERLAQLLDGAEGLAGRR